MHERIGAGGVGIVHAAYDPRLDRRIALKVLRSGSGVGNDELLAEARALAKLCHPNVIGALDVGVHEDVVYLAMDLADG